MIRQAIKPPDNSTEPATKHMTPIDCSRKMATATTVGFLKAKYIITARIIIGTKQIIIVIKQPAIEKSSS